MAKRLTNFHYIEVLFRIFYYFRVKEIVRYSLYRGSLHRGSLTVQYCRSYFKNC